MLRYGRYYPVKNTVLLWASPLLNRLGPGAPQPRFVAQHRLLRTGLAQRIKRYGEDNQSWPEACGQNKLRRRVYQDNY